MGLKEGLLPGVRIKAEHLVKRFGAQEVLRNLSLQVEPGEFVAVVGRSGCGKSTLLRLMAGLDVPDGGRIELDDEPLDGLNSHARVMFQDHRLLLWKKVRENVAIGFGKNKRDPELLEWALQQVGLSQKADDWPMVLSGGQRQRVALARALVSRPRLLLLDEPLGALDALTRIEMQWLIERIWQEQQFTAILVTHDVEEAVALADRVILIENGICSMDLPISLPRPRQRGQIAFAETVDHVLKRILGSQRASLRIAHHSAG